VITLDFFTEEEFEGKKDELCTFISSLL